MRLAVIALLFSACGGDSWQGTIEERDGVLYVDNPAGGIWTAADQSPIRFELEQIFGVDREPVAAILAPIDAVEVDGLGNVYVLSSAPSRLVAFAPDGAVLWSSDQRGQGPGDLSKPYGLAWDGGSTLYLTNQSGQRLDTWSTAGEFLGSRSLSDVFHYLQRTVGFLADGRLVVAGAGGASNDASIIVLDPGNTSPPAVEFSVDVTNDLREGETVFATVAVSGDEIVVGDYDSYEIRWFDGDGNLTKVWTRDFDALMGEATYKPMGASKVFSWLYPPLRLASGHWLTCLSWAETDDPNAAFARLIEDGQSPDQRNALDLFDPEGRLLLSREAEGPCSDVGRPVKVDGNGRLYTIVDEPYPHIRRHAVHLADWSD